ncbi:DNAse I-like superfamily protein [Striga hermonthica]|uniref:DNAse I-like superfamily protein n=1 Tax=Striga hermonthica TaxID=68872 RepID=A0A9N7NT44_STRHE|nr:DNAse I-like superfamily protein [Striga hermonthica]
MRAERRYPKSSWPTAVVRKWLNMKTGRDEFHSDYKNHVVVQRRRKSCSDDGLYVVVPEELSEEWSMQTRGADQRPGFNQIVPFIPSTTNLRGIMGYLGNKGAISVSMVLDKTSFCFVCTHLASGDKGGDAIRRNLDVMEIMKRTTFSHPFGLIQGKSMPPQNILDHDKIIWLGDLNYRLSSSCGDTYELLQKNDWQALLEKDELRIEQKAGRIFKGWEEGEIFFAPTYKYITDSDHYVVQTSSSKEKRRTPAWCDRILWKGEGIKQLCYVRAESRFSDHRPFVNAEDLFTDQGRKGLSDFVLIPMESICCYQITHLLDIPINAWQQLNWLPHHIWNPMLIPYID